MLVSFVKAHSQKNSKLSYNQPRETGNQTNVLLEPFDYRVDYVTIDIHHQYGISVAEAKTSLLAKHL